MQNSIGKTADTNGIVNRLNKANKAVDGGDFSKTLQDSARKINKTQVETDKAMADIDTGEVKNLHQAALSIGKAETSMKAMLEIRNKALSAYKEITRTQH